MMYMIRTKTPSEPRERSNIVCAYGQGDYSIASYAGHSVLCSLQGLAFGNHGLAGFTAIVHSSSKPQSAAYLKSVSNDARRLCHAEASKAQ